MGKKNEAARMLANLNGPWSNAACMGYCLIAMRRANLRPGAQRRVLMVLEQCFDDVSVGYAEFAERLSAYNMSQAEFIRQAITGAAIRPIITVSPVNDELLAAVGKLTAEYGRIGGNLNQIARTLNEWHSPYPQLAGEVRAAVSDLAALKFEVLQKVGDAVGNIQTYQL